MTTIDNTICTTQTLLELSLKPLLYEWWDKNSYYQATPYSKRKPCYYLSPPLPPPKKKKKILLMFLNPDMDISYHLVMCK